VRPPQKLSRALDDLHAIATEARAAPKRAARVEKRLAAIQSELESIDRRLGKLGKRVDRNVDATKDVRKAVKSVGATVERMDSGIDVVAESTQPIEPKLAMLHTSVQRLASQLERDGGGAT
jgi:chromosome segregation ATPase